MTLKRTSARALLPALLALVALAADCGGGRSLAAAIVRSPDEAALYQRLCDVAVEYGRYACAWGADWDLPLQRRMGGPISNDPALCSRILKVVNSSLFGLTRPATNLGQALDLAKNHPLHRDRAW